MRLPSFATSALSRCIRLCLPLSVSLAGLASCTIHEESEPPAQSAPAAIAPAPVVATPLAAAPAAVPAAQQPTIYRPTVEAPARELGTAPSNGAASAPPATHVATAPAAGVATAPPAGVATAPAAPSAATYIDDPEVVVNAAPPQARPELLAPSPGAGFAWVPGHWAWRNAWVWVPGSWKAIPVGRRQWVAGQWSAEAGQYRWHPGYWA